MNIKCKTHVTLTSHNRVISTDQDNLTEQFFSPYYSFFTLIICINIKRGKVFMKLKALAIFLR